jgi:hypothetical protein
MLHQFACAFIGEPFVNDLADAFSEFIAIHTTTFVSTIVR